MLIILLLIVCLVRSVNAFGIGKWGLTTTTRRLTFTTIRSSVVDEYEYDEGRSPTSAILDEFIVADYDDDNLLRTPPTKTTWDVADDWNSLSSSAVVSGIFTLNNDNNGDDDNSIDDVAGSAAGRWESSSPIIHGDDEESTTDQHGITTLRNIMNTEDADFVEDAIESISNNLDYNDPDDLVGLYDAYSSTSASAISTTTRTTTMTVDDDNRMKKSMKDVMKEEEEIALVVRCDRSPIGLLVEQGKALPELTTAMKYSPRHLLMSTTTSDDNDDDDDDDDKGMLLPLTPKATPFLDNAIRRIFSIYSTESKDDAIMDRDAIAKWMTTCISSPLPPPSTSTTVIDKESSLVVANKAIDNIGPYDRDVSAVLSRYSQKFGSGRLTLPEFADLYLEATWAGYINDITQKKILLYDDDNINETNETSSRRYYKFPSPNVGILFQDRKNTEGMILKLASLSIVWRDLEAHGIFSPAEEERVRTLLEMERLHPSSTTDDSNRNNNNNLHPSLMDECVLFDEYEERLSRRNSEDNDDADDIMGVESAWDFLKRKDGGREKSSHELVEMTTDGKTPKRIRDGQFVFIDEETCIGCAQCAQIAPSAFKMIEDSGRFRTFQQSSSVDVNDAVASCPVNCMHFMSFDELKEMEVSRDDGDGRSDHRHFGKGKQHTPLHVSRTSNDSNHKSSWYHYLKTKCHGSASCPQRGCFDCPTYAPGQNPFFLERHRQAESNRARDFILTGEADKWRKVVEL